MVFNSLTFVIFFAVFLVLHNLPFPWKVKKFNLLLASYLFYAAWNPPFVLLLIISAVVDFFLARRLGQSEKIGTRRWLLAGSLLLNLGVLSYFKYGQFLLDNFTALMGTLGISYHAPSFSIILPLGISFYTFETISYLMDVYHRRITPWKSFIDYALFLTFFPHLVAGPIVRAADFLPQCAEPRQANARQLAWGLCLMILGLFQKIVIADGLLAPVADSVYNNVGGARFVDAWIGTLAFSGQIFCDFAGYSTCGIGAALCLGFVLKDNFRFPYASIGFSDFWQRWHISLSSWLRDYVYISFGGNRKGHGKTYRNLMLTMLIGGLWHGAAWRFVAWGGLHGFYLMVERFLKKHLGGHPVFNKTLVKILLVLLTYMLVCITWVLFRAANFSDAFQLFSAMFNPTTGGALVSGKLVGQVLAVTAALLVGHWLLRESSLEHAVSRSPRWLTATALIVMILCIMLAPGDDRAFIYFQF